MKIFVAPELYNLALACPRPLYVVGGYVRNFLIGGIVSDDLDIASALPASEFAKIAESRGFNVVAVYPRTNTVKIARDSLKCEYTSFRKDVYASGGGHSPLFSELTEDIKEDALRRDFKCNAVYYDVKKERTADPLGGEKDIKNRVLSTVKSADEVFSADGLRLMRLARFAGELGFEPDAEALAAAKANAGNIADISPERIYDELKKILVSDGKYPFSVPDGHYRGLKILEQTRVLDYIAPQLTAGRGMFQRADFHKYDVLEHSLKTVYYAPEKVRLAALLHDSGKPYCMNAFGKYHGHAEEGIRIAGEILARLKADKKTVRQVKFLVGAHMTDLAGDMKEIKVRRFIAENYDMFPALFELKQADFSAGMDCAGEPPSLIKWKKIFSEMQRDGTPFTLRELNISARDLEKIGFYGEAIGRELCSLRNRAVEHPELNERGLLIAAAEKDFEKGAGK